MNKIVIIIAFLALLCFSSTAHTTFAQDNTAPTTTVITDEDNPDNTNSGIISTIISDGDSNSKKDKDKGKDEVKIGKKFLINFLINLLTMLIIILVILLPSRQQMESIFTFFMFNVVIYMLTYVLNEIKISMGAAFGLFAVFSMLRYRTQGISMKEMTYLFIFIAIGLISAVRLEYFELSIINGIIVLFTFILGSKLFFKPESMKRINYENIDLVKAENHALLIEDLKKRTGLDIHRVEIRRINFLRDTANIRVYYYEKKQSAK